MQTEANPYQAPAPSAADEAVNQIRRPAIGTVLLVLWTIEASFKTCVMVAVFGSHGFNGVQFLANDYRSSNRILFFVLSSFFIIETIGPWIGIYYLTGRRARTIPFDKAIYRILTLAGGIAIVLSLVLMMYLELTSL